MTDAFQPPRESSASRGTQLTTLRVVAIIAIALGAIGLLMSLFQGVSLLFLGAIQGAAMAAIPMAVRDEYQVLLDTQATYVPVGALIMLGGFVLSITQLIGGISVVRGSSSSLLSWAALGNAGYYVLGNVIWAPLQMMLIWPAMEQYIEATKSLPGGEAGAAGAQAGSLGGILFGVVIGLALAGFWGWVWTVANPQRSGEAGA